MKALKCDRCKRYYDMGEHKNIIFDLYRYSNHVDLCPNCQVELGKWFEEK